ncbi:MAG: helix-turn-helix domain-containing protein [Chloroflexi bacterium]|nr:helix-turn-helix domain-containing protein [Chloroflexota bacterium]
MSVEPPTSEQLRSPADVAQFLGVREHQVRQWIVSGVLPGRRIDGKMLVDVRAVERLLVAREQAELSK